MTLKQRFWMTISRRAEWLWHWSYYRAYPSLPPAVMVEPVSYTFTYGVSASQPHYAQIIMDGNVEQERMLKNITEWRDDAHLTIDRPS